MFCVCGQSAADDDVAVTSEGGPVTPRTDEDNISSAQLDGDAVLLLIVIVCPMCAVALVVLIVVAVCIRHRRK